MTARGDALIQRILQGGTSNDSEELMAEFGAGYPISNLRRLLQSERDDAVQAGAWIASELGDRLLPLVADLSRLLHHRSHFVRAYALDAILQAATPANGDILAEALGAVHDEHRGVRWTAMHFLKSATVQQLRASIRYLRDIQLAAQVKWLLDVTANLRAQEIVNALDDTVAVKRAFAAAAAARIVGQSLVPLQHASGSAHEDIRSFARGVLERQ